MPCLLLLRHAKSSWGEPPSTDFDRPLTERGRAAARRMGGFMRAHALLPDRILCSTALRTRETLAALVPIFEHDCDIRLLRDLYDDSEGDYAEAIRRHGGRAKNLLVIGHNPATQQTAMTLAASADAATSADVRDHFPTAALAILDFDISEWAELAPDNGRLRAFHKARDIEDHSAGGNGR